MDVVYTAELAGYNAARKGLGLSPFELPKSLAAGAFIAHVGELLKTDEGLYNSPQADKDLLISLGVYREKEVDITQAVQEFGLTGVYDCPLNR